MDALNQGLELQRQGQIAEALPFFQQAVQEQPTSLIALTNLAAAQIDMNSFDEALQTTNEALDLDSQDASVWILRAQALNNLQRVEEAIAACNQAITCDPSIAFAHMYKGSILASQERDQEALVEYDQALMIDSTSLETLVRKAGSLGVLQRFAEARVIGERLIALYPEDAEGWSIKAAALHIGTGENKQALIAIEKALAIEPNDSMSLTTKASILEAMGRTGEARSALKKAAAIDASNSIAHDGLQKMDKRRNEQALNVTGNIIGAIFSMFVAFVKAIFTGL